MIKRASCTCALAFTLGFAAGCGEGRGPIDEKRDTAKTKPATTTATGCLTAKNDRFVLTDLERAAGQGATSRPATETYQLVGADDRLRAHVGQQVRVIGEAEPPNVAEVRESTPPTASGATGTSGSPQTNPQGQEPKVTTETETRMEVARLRVQSVEPTGSSCAAETSR